MSNSVVYSGEKCPNSNALIKKQWPKTNEVSRVSIKFYLSKEKFA